MTPLIRVLREDWADPDIALPTYETAGAAGADIRANLESQGYIVQEIEFEDGAIEVEALLDGREVELELARDTGAVIEIETEGEDDDD